MLDTKTVLRDCVAFMGNAHGQESEIGEDKVLPVEMHGLGVEV